MSSLNDIIRSTNPFNEDTESLMKKFSSVNITADMVMAGVENGIVSFHPETDDGHGIICRINNGDGDGVWDFGFYFASQDAEEMTPEEYINSMGIWNVVDEICSSLESLKSAVETFEEWLCYLFRLNETVG